MTHFTPTQLRQMAEELAFDIGEDNCYSQAIRQAAEDAEDAERYRFARDHGKAFENYYGCEYQDINRTIDTLRRSQEKQA